MLVQDSCCVLVDDQQSKCVLVDHFEAQDQGVSVLRQLFALTAILVNGLDRLRLHHLQACISYIKLIQPLNNEPMFLSGPLGLLFKDSEVVIQFQQEVTQLLIAFIG